MWYLASMDKTKLSKFLSYVLRHKPDSIGVEMDSAGWVNIEELLAKRDEEILLHAMDSEAGNVHLGEQLRAKSPQGPAVPKA